MVERFMTTRGRRRSDDTSQVLIVRDIFIRNAYILNGAASDEIRGWRGSTS